MAFDSRPSARALVAWLLVCCALVFAMVVVGGVTRLTHSGLSITEWQPIVGTIPPMSAADWNDAFSKYQATPEYRDVNRDMTQAEFRRIFWWEYFHRLLGRTIGIAYPRSVSLVPRAPAHARAATRGRSPASFCSEDCRARSDG